MNYYFTKFIIEHFRIKMSDIKSERHFNDSMSSLSSFQYMIEMIIYNLLYTAVTRV